MLMSDVLGIHWRTVQEGVPAFITIAAMPLTYSIAYGGLGLAFLLCSYSYAPASNSSRSGSSGSCGVSHPLSCLIAGIIGGIISYCVINGSLFLTFLTQARHIVILTQPDTRTLQQCTTA